MSQIIYKFNGLSLSEETRILTGKDNQPIPLTPTLFDLLLVFIKSNGKVLSKAELLKKVWQENNTNVEYQTVRQDISILRKKLGDSERKEIIQTVPGRGYQFMPQIIKIGGDKEKEPSFVWKKSIPYIVFGLLIAALSVSFMTFFERKDDRIEIKSEKTTIHLNLNALENENSSSAVISINYLAIKRDEADEFLQRIGYSEGQIKIQRVSEHSFYEKVVTGIKDKCGSVTNSIILHFDVSQEKLEKSFNLAFNIIRKGGFDKKSDWWYQHKIVRPTDELELTITFPQDKEFPKEIFLYQKEDCTGERKEVLDEYNFQGNEPKEFKVDFVNKTVTFIKKNPTIDYAYGFEWNY